MYLNEPFELQIVFAFNLHIKNAYHRKSPTVRSQHCDSYYSCHMSVLGLNLSPNGKENVKFILMLHKSYVLIS